MKGSRNSLLQIKGGGGGCGSGSTCGTTIERAQRNYGFTNTGNGLRLEEALALTV